MRLLTALLLLLTSVSPAGPIVPVVGMTIDQSVTVAAGEHVLRAPESNRAAILVRGDNLIVDFSNATLVGSDDPTRPDLFSGRAIDVKGNHVTIKGLVARGYKIALNAADCRDLQLIDCDLSYNYRPRLKSTPWKEDLDDWMSFHHNEAGEWIDHGAAVCLTSCDRFLIRNLTVTGGQNGVLLTACNNGLMHSCNISFNSGVGVGLYRSSGNRFTMNRLDYNVRGHSEGVYNRGQDSAAFLVYEQSSNNIFDRNSATHSGDGFFLWAGQSTMDTGAGGCNDNLIAANDFSYAPTNGIEVTFSRNQLLHNTIHGCWHGIWGGYSYDSDFSDNDFANNVEAINIEHGQNNLIRRNQFNGDGVGIHLYERGTPDDWGYGKARDTHSRNYHIDKNHFSHMPVALRVRDTKDVFADQNVFDDVNQSMDAGEFSIEPDAGATTRPAPRSVPESLPDALLPAPLVDLPRERGTIRVTEWGPHDYRCPLVWPDVQHDPSGRTLLLFAPAGNRGAWRINTPALRDLPIEQAGLGMQRLILPSEGGKLTDLPIELQWSGEKPSVDAFGRNVPVGQVVDLAYRHFSASLKWEVQFFGWDDASDPRQTTRVFEGQPIASTSVDRLNFRSSGS